MIGPAMAYAAGSAAAFAASTSLQHRSAGQAPERGTITHLLRQPAWLVGLLAGGVAFVLHAAALGGGPLAVIQPIVVCGVVLAVPARAALARSAPSAREVGWAATAALGLGLLAVSADPGPRVGAPRETFAAMAVAAGGLGAAAASAAAARARTPNARGLLLGLGAGLLFGLAAGALELAVRQGVDGLATHWSAWAVAALGVCGVALNQRAYRAAPLSISMPALNIVDVLVAIGFGAVVFGEIPAYGPVAVLVDIVAITLAAVGVRRLTAGNGIPARVRSGAERERDGAPA